MKTTITVALAGNPNSGKTTLFNNITGSRQHVGNYPGVTVEKKEGVCHHKGRELKIVDLPGTYSLTAYSIEEVVARNFIIDEKPDVVIDVVDASNLERNLYLGVQLLELGVPVVFAFNMSDVAKSRGLDFDLAELSSMLGAPIVQTVGHKNSGTQELLDAAVRVADEHRIAKAPKIPYGPDIEQAIAAIRRQAEHHVKFANDTEARWIAVKLLENDQEVVKRFPSSDVLDTIRFEQARIEKVLGDSAEMIIADRRYGFISGACQGAVRATVETRHTRSDLIDEIVIHRVWGLPIFLGLMYLVFWLTFTVGTPPMEWIEGFFGWLGERVTGWWPAGSDSLLKSLLVDGIISGVGGVLVFLPNILLLFLAIAILEDSGYMARAAFMMDRVMHKIGLHGKSFIPMLTGFGCSIPGIMATRTLENRRDRLTTMLVLPLISCGARLPIYALIIPAFFPEVWHAPMLWIIYVIGIVLAIICAKIFRSTLFKGESVPFVMELPPYRMPTLKGVLIHMWERGSLYLKKAGTLILAVSILLWAMTSFPRLETVDPGLSAEEQQAAELSHTIAGRIGHAMEPVIKPLGFDWRIGTAMIGAFAAKEVFVAQMGIVHSVGEADEESESLREKLRAAYSPLVGFCIMLFMLISAPCMATIAVTKRESNSWKWALFQLGGLTVLAYVVTLIVYQIGSALGIGLG
ncbi:MAG: ferrous iron transport protein B [Kiritimatiellia bacterium]|jgi:ferrous iron transport protein B